MIDFSKIYKEEILEKISAVIVDYKTTNGKFCYDFKHHVLDGSAKEKICELLINNVAFYAYNKEELTESLCAYTKLRDMAKHTFSERLAKRLNYKSDGLVGELLLDIIIQYMKKDEEKLYTRTKYTQISDNQEIKGYDAAYFIRKGDSLELWLGQSKAGKKINCTRGIVGDLNQKYCEKYFTNVLRYIVDRSRSEVKDPILLDLVHQINAIVQKTMTSEKTGEERKAIVEKEIMQLLIDKNVSVVAPCLIAFDSVIYGDVDKFKDEMEELSKKIYTLFESKTFALNGTLDIKVIFIILPISELDDIKQKIIDLKKEVQ